MNAHETYHRYVSLKLHFDSEKYDYFKYRGFNRSNKESFEKRPDRRFFIETSQLKNPLEFMIGNFIFNDSKHISQFNETHRRKYRKYLKNGEYIFREDLKKLHPTISKNFTYDNIPAIIYLYMQEEVSFFSLCVFETVLGLSEKWSKSESFILFKGITMKMKKSAPFFNIDRDKYKMIIKDHFNV